MVTNYKYNTLNQIATFYDKPLLNAAGGNNLRNRIAAVAFYDQYMPDSLSYQTATHYSYDIHGNVKRLVQDIPDLIAYSRKLTYIDYEYDLVSGNVNKVWFQKGKPEQFMHRYRYDSDNRLTHVYTSNTILITQIQEPAFFPPKFTFHTQERLETRYFYLPNGMLSRVELGQKNVQGTDYAYTLQGWLKDINGYRTTPSGLLARHDIGFDGQFFETVDNSEFCRDAFSTMLQYHHDDFSPISGSNYYNRDYIHAVPLFNGNISALTTDYLTTGINPLVKFFRYDKLNRIKGMKTNSDAGNPQCQPFNTYSTYYTYDHNGNIDTLIRYDSETNELHYIEYEYLSGNNRLDSITAWWGLNTGGYRYDAIGNLARDNGEGLDISWNAAGKVDTIWKNGNVLSTFRYSATGQRQMKKTRNITDYYIHDASGNVMCIYRVSKRDFKAVERPIYGAKRLGELKQQIDLTTPTNPSIPPFTIGMRQYELTDHLGNVMATILDRRQPMTLANSDAYLPWIVSTTDYYPFGYPIPNRSTNTGGYRYFFNGQEVDSEVFGENSLFAFEYRMHDARLGRFWSVDPLAAKYPWNSTYAFAENRVIDGRELEGLEVSTINDNRVAVDPGHGIMGTRNSKVDPGAVGNGFYEKDIVLNIAENINKNLSDWGLETKMTRTGDLTVDKEQISYRISVAHDFNADLFVSVHANASRNSEVKGFLVCFNPDNPLNGDNSRSLAENIVSTQLTMPIFNDGLQKRSNLGVLNQFRGSASVLVEVGFISNESDVALMTQNAESIGREIALGIYKYLFQTEPSPPIQSRQISPNQTFPIMQQDNTRTGNNTMGGW